ncbi:rhomboid family intramembrane serine protease [Cellvibrio sp. KY-GH-1]|uniref:rhomboid family intramembrane serine protease n=1 Tax=Cellvibrio sp. KY-GH-1 TaxID=2303332 RepID=UPI001249162F|nr:rhomboid family intramembrane serine protease [Cellvibrio sp. KY-GH-1]QEY15762.1 rhomboid family intramembrane serine protease [Cellvibrio sp. KY-GH-1]
MIIVPTEKQLDWRHAPLVLCMLVFINVMVFFLYQSSDTSKIVDAITQYQTQGFFEREWPVFEKYLRDNNEQELADDYRDAVADEDATAVIGDLLMRENFYRHLQQNARTYFNPDFYDHWAPQRELLHKRIQSVSFVAHGLTAANLTIPALFTHQFLHGDLMHLLGNMFFLIVCGFAVEAAIGHWRFLVFYLLSGAAGGLAHAAADWENTAPLVGASGAISGVMAMYLAVFRWKKIEFFYWFFFVVGYFRAPALLILPFYLGKELHSYYTDTGSNVAFMAHAGGFVAGAVVIGFTWFFNRAVFNTEYIDSDQQASPRQQQLADVYDNIEKFRFEKALSLVDVLIQQQGLDFELALIRYNLLKIFRGDSLQQAALGLLTLPLLTPTQIKRLDKVWQENPDVRSQLSEQAALKLGMQFASLDNPTSAEQVFNALLSMQSKNPALAVFASKLAASFQHLREHQKKAHYELLASQLAQGVKRELL